MASTIHPVILCGGSGTRLWPLSRALHPKQLLALTGSRSLLQNTALRVADPDRFDKIDRAALILINAQGLDGG